jgi:hypothetical protein
MSTLKYWRPEYEELIQRAAATEPVELLMPAMAKR